MQAVAPVGLDEPRQVFGVHRVGGGAQPAGQARQRAFAERAEVRLHPPRRAPRADDDVEVGGGDGRPHGLRAHRLRGLDHRQDRVFLGPEVEGAQMPVGAPARESVWARHMVGGTHRLAQHRDADALGHTEQVAQSAVRMAHGVVPQVARGLRDRRAEPVDALAGVRRVENQCGGRLRARRDPEVHRAQRRLKPRVMGVRIRGKHAHGATVARRCHARVRIAPSAQLCACGQSENSLIAARKRAP